MSKIITKNQLNGDIAEFLVAYILSSKLNIIYRPISKRDTGVDAEIELTEEIDESKYRATGIFIKVQIKSSTQKEFSNGELPVYLSENDINYFTTDMNLPGLLIFANLKSEDSRIYWAEINPKRIEKSKPIIIKEKNVISKDSVESFRKIESYYRSIKLRDGLISFFNSTADLIYSTIEASETDYSLSYVLSDYYDQLIKIRDVYELSYVENAKRKDYPEELDLISNAMVFSNLIKGLISNVDLLLEKKDFDKFETYVDIHQ